MAKVRFTGVPGERHVGLDMFGVYLPLGQFVEFPAGKELEKLKAHPHFEVQKPVDAEDIAFKEVKKPSRSDLVQTAEALGVKVDGRWSDERLIDETEKAAKVK